MNGFWGADTEALRAMGTVCTRRADALAGLEGMLSSTIENLEWVGEDAERFRADWSGIVRTGLQDREVELRHHARRLAQHADEQEAVSAPDGPALGIGGAGGIGSAGVIGGGGWSSPGEFLRDVLERTEEALGELLGGGGGGAGGQEGPFGELLREVLSTPEGRSGFLGAYLGSALGGLLADMVTRAIGAGMALENLLTGLGMTAGLSNLLGEATQPPAETGTGPGAQQSAAAGEPGGAGTDGGSGSGNGSGAGAEPGGGAGGGSGGGSGGGGGAAAGGAAGSETAGADGGGAASGTQGHAGLQATEAGPAQSLGTGPDGPLRAREDEGPQSLLERLLDMLGDTFGTDAGGSSGSSIGENIGTAGLGGPPR